MRILLLFTIFHASLFAQEVKTNNDTNKVFFKYTVVKQDSIGQYLIDSLKIDETDKPLLGTLYPNPFSPTLQMELYLPQEDSIRMELFDFEGNFIDYPLIGKYSQGLYKLMPNFYFDKSTGLIFRTHFSDTIITTKMLLLR